MMMVVLVVVAVILPHLPPLGQKITVVIAALPILFGLFYMIVIPGWTPNSNSRLKPPWSWVVFIIIAIPIVAVVFLFVIA